MRDKGLIIAGLVVFIGLITFPVWYDMAAGAKAAPPEIKLPANEKACVAPADYMKTSHMELLMSWRDKVVRENVRTYVASDGKSYTMSLTRTCLKCHDSKADFCDKCHDYVAVKPYCWDCHIDPKLVARSEG